MNPVVVQVMEALWVLTAFVLVVGVYRKAPGMWDRWLEAKIMVHRIHAEEKDKDRLHHIAVAESDARMRHNDRNILMVGQAELLASVMAANKENLAIVCDGICRYPGRRPDDPLRENIRGETGGKIA